jgi:hypothetical protein
MMEAVTPLKRRSISIRLQGATPQMTVISHFSLDRSKNFSSSFTSSFLYLHLAMTLAGSKRRLRFPFDSVRAERG